MNIIPAKEKRAQHSHFKKYSSAKKPGRKYKPLVEFGYQQIISL